MMTPSAGPKSLKPRKGGAKKKPKILGNKIVMLAILWCVLVTITLVCLLFLFRNVLNHSSNEGDTAGGLLHHINNANNVDTMKSYVEKLMAKNKLLGPTTTDHEAPRVVEDRNGDNQNSIQTGGADVTVAFAVSVTGCGSDPLTEGAAVLKQSIHRASVRGSLGGRYNYKMYAIYHPQAEACAKTLEALGYELLKRDTFVKVSEIEGDYLRENIEKNGCCGEKELIKLEAYTLVQHPVVVHLDLDVLVLKPLDNLFDVMLQNEKNPGADLDLSHIDIQWDPEHPMQQVNALFTRDYNMVAVKKKYKPVQGGFLVIRPSMDVYNEFKAIVKKGDFRKSGGWGGSVGPFYGSMTFQGIMPYYYDVLHPGEAIELNRCVVNQMCDNPRDAKTVNDIVQGNCRTGESPENCEDCRSRPIEDVITTHYTLCQKPWLCIPQDHDMIQQRLCRKLHHEWYRIRSEMEKSWGRTGKGPGEWQADQFFGYCSEMGKKGYIPIQTPYGTATPA